MARVQIDKDIIVSRAAQMANEVGSRAVRDLPCLSIMADTGTGFPRMKVLSFRWTFSLRR